MSKESGARKSGRKPTRTFGSLEVHQKNEALDEFALALTSYLERKPTAGEPEGATGKTSKKDAVNKDAVVEAVGKKLGCVLDPRQFEPLLRGLYEAGHLRIAARTDPVLALGLRQKFGLDVTVVSGGSEDHFARVAAESFIRRMYMIGAKKGRGGELCVGIMSGSTTKSVIDQAQRMASWSKEVGIAPSDLPKVRVFALNVSYTDARYLDGNATILAYRLAEKIREQCGKHSAAEAYGLSAPVLVREDRPNQVDSAKRNDSSPADCEIHIRFALRSQVDNEPQTKEILRYTETSRVDQTRPNTETALDVVLTGIGDVPIGESGGSIFYELAGQAGFDMAQMIADHHIVGDLGFTPLQSNGESAPLIKDGEEYMFYSAVRLRVLEAMAKKDREEKAVILVARSTEGRYKIPAIFASIGGAKGRTGTHRYASHLIVDKETARALERF